MRVSACWSGLVLVGLAVSGRGRRAVGTTAAKGTEVWLEMRA
jgi:hypothetical protein